MTLPYIAIATPLTPIWWPAKYIQEKLDFQLDISGSIDLNSDRIATVTASAAPSGDGELAISGLKANNNVISLVTAIGQPSRVYTIKFVARMTDARVYEFIVHQAIPLELDGYPIPLPPFPGFGPELVFTAQQGVIAIYGQSQYNTQVVYGPSAQGFTAVYGQSDYNKNEVYN